MNAIPQGAGSGTIWSSDGFIVTNYHVRGASAIVKPLAPCYVIELSPRPEACSARQVIKGASELQVCSLFHTITPRLSMTPRDRTFILTS